MEELKALCDNIVKNIKGISYQLFMFSPFYFNLLLFKDDRFTVGIEGNFYQVKSFLKNKLDKINSI